MTGNTLAATHLPVGGLAARWVFFRKKTGVKGIGDQCVFLKKTPAGWRSGIFFIF
jgi:hypothetical protein